MEVPQLFEAAGIAYLHLVDLDGAKSKHIVNAETLYKIATGTNLKIDFGGGLKSNEDVRLAFENGAAQITGGSIAATDPALFMEWAATYGSDKIILGADCNNREISTHGWQQTSETDVIDFISLYEKRGIKYVICTDIHKDGMLQGAANELYVEILSVTDIKLIASGGVSCIADIKQLQQTGCEAAIIGKAIYENKISLKELSTVC